MGVTPKEESDLESILAFLQVQYTPDKMYFGTGSLCAGKGGPPDPWNYKYFGKLSAKKILDKELEPSTTLLLELVYSQSIKYLKGGGPLHYPIVNSNKDNGYVIFLDNEDYLKVYQFDLAGSLDYEAKLPVSILIPQVPREELNPNYGDLFSQLLLTSYKISKFRQEISEISRELDSLLKVPESKRDKKYIDTRKAFKARRSSLQRIVTSLQLKDQKLIYGKYKQHKKSEDLYQRLLPQLRKYDKSFRSTS